MNQVFQVKTTRKKAHTDNAPKETMKELNAISDELLKKAGLTDMNEKLKTFLL